MVDPCFFVTGRDRADHDTGVAAGAAVGETAGQRGFHGGIGRQMNRGCGRAGRQGAIQRVVDQRFQSGFVARERADLLETYLAGAVGGGGSEVGEEVGVDRRTRLVKRTDVETLMTPKPIEVDEGKVAA